VDLALFVLCLDFVPQVAQAVVQLEQDEAK